MVEKFGMCGVKDKNRERERERERVREGGRINIALLWMRVHPRHLYKCGKLIGIFKQTKLHNKKIAKLGSVTGYTIANLEF